MAMQGDALQFPVLDQWVRTVLLPLIESARPANYAHVLCGYVKCSSEVPQHPHRARGA